jgi:low molecular weight protein-tyrosine phosphatase
MAFGRRRVVLAGEGETDRRHDELRGDKVNPLNTSTISLGNAMATSSVLFLCTGNYYRSRFAEEYFNYHAPMVARNWVAFSRGLSPRLGTEDAPDNPGPISIHALAFLDLYQVRVRDLHRYPRRVERADFENADRVVALCEREHKNMLTVLHPEYARRAQYFAIEDINIDEPSTAIPKLVQSLDRLMNELD